MAGLSLVDVFTKLPALIKKLSTAVSDIERAARTTELYEIIATAQRRALEDSIQMNALLQDNNQLKEELARAKAWEEKKQRYTLHELQPGTFVYALKEAHQATEPAHGICQKCYEDGFQSVIQLQRHSGSGRHFHCPRCSWSFLIRE